MEYFYFYKSCDVKLLRRLIYDRNAALAKVIKPSEWRTFDLVTEVNDDVVDLQEDTTTINGNRFLISLLQFGKKKTVQIFNDFLDEMDVRNRALDVKSIEGVEFIEWTDSQIRETKELVVSQAALVDGLDLGIYERFLGVEIKV
jgi:DNA helicase IV